MGLKYWSDLVFEGKRTSKESLEELVQCQQHQNATLGTSKVYEYYLILLQSPV
jgi:hypothetical protein